MIQVVLLSLKLGENQKKRSSPKIEEYFPPKLSKYKKVRSLPQFGTIFGRNWWDLLELTSTFLSDLPELKSRWGTLTLDRGTRSQNTTGCKSGRAFRV